MIDRLLVLKLDAIDCEAEALLNGIPVARASPARPRIVVPVHEYTAGQVKQAVVGKGRAAKSQVQEMVRRLLQLSGTPSPDAADALACAICHAHGSVGVGALRGAGGSMRRGRPTR